MRTILTYFVSATILTRIAQSTTDLHQQNVNQVAINPINDYEYEDIAKEHDKRTIFGNNIRNYGWAKHVAVNPTGMKYVLGYGAIDLKYLPVARPLVFKPRLPKRPQKPSLMLRPLLPAKPISHSHGWKPIVPVNVPAPPHFISKPWQQEGWSKQPGNIDIHATKPLVHVQPVVNPVVPIQAVPAVPVVKPALPLHPILPINPQIQSLIPDRPIVPVAPSHLVPIAPPPLVPAAPPLPLVSSLKPFIAHSLPPSPLFEVTKPNLGVLPFGATFPSTVLNQIAAPNLAPIPHQPILPGTVLEYHGNHNFVPLNAVPIPQPPVLITHPPRVLIGQTPVPQFSPPTVHQTTFNLQPQHPDIQFPLLPQNHPDFVHIPHGQPVLQQQLPIGHNHHNFDPHLVQQQLPIDNGQQNFNSHGLQQLPIDNGQHNFAPGVVQQPPIPGQHLFSAHNGHQPLPEGSVQLFNPNHHQQQQQQQQQQLPEDSISNNIFNQHSQQIFQQQLPDGHGQHELFNQVSIDHSIHDDHRGAIQPGQTDVQLPVHLPQHPNYLPDGRHFQAGNFHDPNQHPENVLRPSISLETPYQK